MGAAHARTPGANLGTRTITFVPAPGAVSTTSPYSSPNVVRSRASTLPSPTESRSASPASARRTFSGSSPAPSSSTSMTPPGRGRAATIVIRAVPCLSAQPVADGVLDQRLDAEERHGDGEHLGRDPQRDLEPVAEAGLLQQQVALDRAELLGERGELAVPAEGVAGEVGELQQQLAGPVGVGAHERRDRAERVVDEVRADLGPQRAHLGLHQPGPRGVQLGELELRRRPTAATSSAARTSPAVAPSVKTWRVPTIRSSTTSGLTIACADRAARRSQDSSRAVGDPGGAAVDGGGGEAGGLVAVVRGRGRPRPAAPAVSVSATAGEPSSWRRCRMLRSALSVVSPSRSAARPARRCAGCGTWPGRPRCRGGYDAAAAASGQRKSMRRRSESEPSWTTGSTAALIGTVRSGSSSPSRWSCACTRRLLVERPGGRPRGLHDGGLEAAAHPWHLHAVGAAAVVGVQRPSRRPACRSRSSWARSASSVRTIFSSEAVLTISHHFHDCSLDEAEQAGGDQVGGGVVGGDLGAEGAVELAGPWDALVAVVADQGELAAGAEHPGDVLQVARQPAGGDHQVDRAVGLGEPVGTPRRDR